MMASQSSFYVSDEVETNVPPIVSLLGAAGAFAIGTSLFQLYEILDTENSNV
jgi:hypothetical protein